jgi:hypothetical protein
MTTTDPARAPHTSPSEPITFGDEVLAFYRTLPRLPIAAAPVEWIDPVDVSEARRCMELFYRAYYADHRDRLFVFGVNPGRFGAGLTGIPFTDGPTLAETCGIPNTFPPRRELSATFIHRVIAAWGGADAFYSRIYITGVCPLGLIRQGKNVNYYDDRAVLRELEPFLVDAIRRQLGFGARRDVAVVIGAGDNLRVMQRLNAEHRFFAELRALEHPRFIMQYRRRQLDRYVADYLRLFGELLA